MALLDDSGCASPPYGWHTLYTCGAGAAGDFAGMYWKDHTGACQNPNPHAASTCACPAGTTNISLPLDGACWTRQELGICLGAADSPGTFAGAFLSSDVPAYGPCITANPATGACTCPAGSTAWSARAIYGPVTACESTGHLGAFLVLCTVF